MGTGPKLERSMLWLKALHIIFVVTWFAGLFYLPRLFIYHLQCRDEEGIQRFVTMERRLLVITHIGGIASVIFGLALLGHWAARIPGYMAQGWLHGKLALVTLLIAYHLYCMRIAQRMARGERPHSDRWLRFFNEVPAVLLVGTVILVVVRPF